MIATSFVRRAALPGLLALCAFPTTAPADPTSTGGMTLGTTAEAADAPAAVGATTAATAPATSPDPEGTAARGTLVAATPAQSGSWTVPAVTHLGQPVHVSGQLRADLAGRTVRLERQTSATRWAAVSQTRVGSGGRFTVRWRTGAARVHHLRVVIPGLDPATAAAASATHAASTTPTGTAESLRVVVLDRARATWFGPGFYGSKTACGLRMTRATRGVAHRTLPCGTQVEVRMGAKSAVLPVIDRGPFANGADFDLTKNVADELGLTGVDTIRFARRLDLSRLSTPYRAPALGR